MIFNQKISHQDWVQKIYASLGDPKIVTSFGDVLPGFPSEQTQRNTTSLAGQEALHQAAGFYSDVSGILDATGNSIEKDWQIMDFGSCWGRICRFFLRDVPLKNITGLDVDPDFVKICNEIFGSQNFRVSQVFPPCDLASESINLITSYSVFSHLSEASFRAWMLEFHRILKPGGFVSFTTRGDAFFDYCSYLKQNVSTQTGYSKALAEMMLDVDALKERYRSGEFVFVTSDGVSGGGVRNESFYGEAFVPEAYLLRNFSGHYKMEAFREMGTDYDQALFVLRKQ